MNNQKIIYDGSNKSLLRKKWDALFQDIALKRIPNIYKVSNQVLNIENSEQLESLIDPKNFENNKKWKVIILSLPLNNFVNLVNFFNSLDDALDEETKIIVNYYSRLWRPFFTLFSFLGLINNYNLLFFSENTLNTFLRTGNFEISKNLNNFLIPFKMPLISKFFSILLNFLPFLDYLSVTRVFYLRKKVYKKRQHQKMSLIVPCKNEELNIENIVNESKEKLNFPYEIVFINDKSTDKTLKIMEDCKLNNSDIEIKIIEGLGRGRGIAVNEGIKIANGNYSVTFDADMTVGMFDINLFYSTISNGHADFINGSRLIYKPYSGAMRYLNYLGNTFFAKLATFIISEKITDTLCGTQCFITADYKIFNEFKAKNSINDIWGTHNILFSSNFYGLKCVDLPVRYYERLEGETKMTKRIYYFFSMLSDFIKILKRFKINFDKN
tara:strand:+ start:414 stop:1733 length:1320 start_codon:yes stop_codon:yes gene_type:complete